MNSRIAFTLFVILGVCRCGGDGDDEANALLDAQIAKLSGLLNEFSAPFTDLQKTDSEILEAIKPLYEQEIGFDSSDENLSDFLSTMFSSNLSDIFSTKEVDLAGLLDRFAELVIEEIQRHKDQLQTDGLLNELNELSFAFLSNNPSADDLDNFSNEVTDRVDQIHRFIVQAAMGKELNCKLSQEEADNLSKLVVDVTDQFINAYNDKLDEHDKIAEFRLKANEILLTPVTLMVYKTQRDNCYMAEEVYEHATDLALVLIHTYIDHVASLRNTDSNYDELVENLKNAREIASAALESNHYYARQELTNNSVYFLTNIVRAYDDRLEELANAERRRLV